MFTFFGSRKHPNILAIVRLDFSSTGRTPVVAHAAPFVNPRGAIIWAAVVIAEHMFAAGFPSLESSR